MTREIADTPHPTPNPDGPHAPGKPHETKPVPAGRPHEGEAVEEEPYDSFFDDVNKMLSQSIEQPAPDPVLGPRTAEDMSSKPSRPDDPLGRLIRGETKSPRTSEVFKAVVALRSGASLPPPSGAELPADFLRGDSPDPEVAAVATPGSSLRHELVVEQQAVQQESASDDDLVGEAHFPWFQVFILSYATAVTVALSWMVLTGRTSRVADPPANSSSAASEPLPPSKPQPSRLDPKELPPVPPENITTLNSPLRIGDLQVTPLSVTRSRVELVGSIDPSKYRAEESESLVMRLRFTNLSKSRFAPLELAYVREQSSLLDRCFISTPGGTTIGAFPLAVDSEWSIVGQECPVIEGGKTVETVIASESGIADRLGSEMIWRVRLRIGPYRTDVIGVRFRDAEVERDPNGGESALGRTSRPAWLESARSGS